MSLLFSPLVLAQSGMDPSKDYSKQMGRLNNLGEKITTLKSDIRLKVRQKKVAKSQNNKIELIYEIVQLHEEYKKRVIEYNELYQTIRYRFPGKDQISNQKYLPQRVDSLEKLEEDVGLDGQLTRIRKKVEQKYDPLLPKEEKVNREAKKQSTEKKDKKRKRIKMEM